MAPHLPSGRFLFLRFAVALALALPISAGAVRAQPAGESTPTIAARLAGVAPSVTGDALFWSADGARVLFLSTRGGSGLWSVPAAGGPRMPAARDVPTQLVRLSPRGDQIAYLSDRSGYPEIWVQAIGRPGPAAPRQLTDLGARINALCWSPDGQTLAFSALRYGQFDVWTVALSSGRVRRVTSDPRYETAPAWTPDGRRLLYVRSDDRWADHEVMAVPVDGGEARVVAADRDLFDYGTIGTRPRFGAPNVSPDGRWVLFPSHRSGWVNYWVAAVDGGAPVRSLAADTADQSDAAWSPDGRAVAFVSNRNGTFSIQVADAGGEGAVRTMVDPGVGVAGNPTWSPDGRSIAFTLATPTRPAELHVAALDGGASRRLTTSIEPTAEALLIRPEKVSYRSDDLTIAGYLFRPPASAPGGPRRPGIMYIHGGPTGQFSDTYLAQAQFLARIGYVVLAPNIRGSSGYGKAFEDANNPCWTHCDLRDVIAGAAFLKALPEVDSTRLGITGISYGGIMSMGAVAHAPEVFQAAVAQSGYADWVNFQTYNAELQHSKLLAYEWGPWPDSAAVYRRNSPIFSADRVTAPVFVLQGEGRAPAWRPGVLPIPASLEFVHALERLDKVVWYRSYAGETYYVTTPANVARVMVDMAGFFDRYLDRPTKR